MVILRQRIPVGLTNAIPFAKGVNSCSGFIHRVINLRQKAHTRFGRTLLGISREKLSFCPVRAVLKTVFRAGQFFVIVSLKSHIEYGFIYVERFGGAFYERDNYRDG